ncbi:uncharacterized protein LOC143296743 [Babylonia areolata]|uniref:uncharacterized protein LOC143296743 n=1 Tax=Babylonia areolata TaxID=304850 RepID=UPI003FD47D7C
MMIHLGKYMYTCKHCKREFRHKSHFKEHLRQHSGETPFHCEYCRGIGFKTRNTYKRHMKTYHGYILTKDTMLKMSDEEFAKVRTKKYKKSSQRQHDEKSPTSSGSTAPEPIQPVSTASAPPLTPASGPLPPVGTILSGFSPLSSQAPLGILPAMGAIEARAPVGVLGPNTVCHAIVYPTYTSSVQAPISFMPQVTFAMGQPSIEGGQPNIGMGQPGIGVGQPGNGVGQT